MRDMVWQRDAKANKAKTKIKTSSSNRSSRSSGIVEDFCSECSITLDGLYHDHHHRGFPVKKDCNAAAKSAFKDHGLRKGKEKGSCGSLKIATEIAIISTDRHGSKRQITEPSLPSGKLSLVRSLFGSLQLKSVESHRL